MGGWRVRKYPPGSPECPRRCRAKIAETVDPPHCGPVQASLSREHGLPCGGSHACECCASFTLMKLRATVLALLFFAFTATSVGQAVATPSVVDQYTEQPPSPGGGGFQPGGGASPGSGGNGPGSGGNGPSEPSTGGQSQPPGDAGAVSAPPLGDPVPPATAAGTDRASKSKVKPDGNKRKSGREKVRSDRAAAAEVSQDEAAAPLRSCLSHRAWALGFRSFCSSSQSPFLPWLSDASATPSADRSEP